VRERERLKAHVAALKSYGRDFYCGALQAGTAYFTIRTT